MRKSIQKPFGRDELIKEVRKEIKRIRSVKIVDYDKNRKDELPASNIVRKKLGDISWEDVLQLCGYEPFYKSMSKEKIIDLATSQNRQLRFKELEEIGVKYHNVMDHFGSYKNFYDALNWEYEEKEIYSDVTKDELISEYDNVCKTIGKTATAKDLDENSKFPSELYRSNFGTINELKKLAGYDYHRDPRTITKEECMREMLLIYGKYGRVSYGQLHKILPFHYRTLLRKFGTTSVKVVWKEVIEEYERRSKK